MCCTRTHILILCVFFSFDFGLSLNSEETTTTVRMQVRSQEVAVIIKGAWLSTTQLVMTILKMDIIHMMISAFPNVIHTAAFGCGTSHWLARERDRLRIVNANLQRSWWNSACYPAMMHLIVHGNVMCAAPVWGSLAAKMCVVAPVDW